MQKTFCDKCGAECVNYKMIVQGHVEHSTSQGEEVGEDYLGRRELCRGCGEAMITAFGFTVRVHTDLLREKQQAEEMPRPVRGDFG